MGSGQILIVDDEESIRFTFRSFLQDEGYEVSTAVTGVEALSVLDSTEVDLVYLDIVLGGRSGIEILADVKERWPAVEVVIITGAPNVDTAADALRLGALDYLVKPVRHDTLIASAGMAFTHMELRQARETYRRHLEAIFRSVRDGIITVDRDLHTVELNPAAERLLGVSRDEVLGRPIDLAHLTGGLAAVEALERAIHSGAPVALSAVQLGDERIVDLTASPLRVGDEELAGGVLVVHDQTRIHELEQCLREQRQFGTLIGQCQPMLDIKSTIQALADVQTSVLITGESGTGKEMVAEALHQLSPRHDRSLVKVNCSALSESLLESELFGHVRGAFTGADRNKVGRFERANGGTIFLDEIGDLTPQMQLRFLRVLERKTFERVGDSTPVEVDVRVIAATNRNLKRRVAAGEFRQDLYYRLKVFEIPVPPLRHRREDIPLLVRHFIAKLNAKLERQVAAVSDEVMSLFLRYPWPGNVRELENALEHAFVLCRSATVSAADLPADLRGHGAPVAPGEAGAVAVGAAEGEVIPLDEMERRYLEWAARSFDGDRSELARRLGLSERTLYRKIRQARQGEEDDRGSDNPGRA